MKYCCGATLEGWKDDLCKTTSHHCTTE